LTFPPGYFLAILFFYSIATKADESIEIHRAWINEAPPGIKINAGYMDIENKSEQAVTLTEVHSEIYDRIEMHQSRIVTGIATMKKLDGIKIPANGFVSLSPGDSHLMMFDPVKPVIRNNLIKLTFTFSDGSTLDCDVPVRKIHSQHQHH